QTRFAARSVCASSRHSHNLFAKCCYWKIPPSLQELGKCVENLYGCIGSIFSPRCPNLPAKILRIFKNFKRIILPAS
ncbi:unnamed protein product, partial [Callosobruchus maculatus]